MRIERDGRLWVVRVHVNISLSLLEEVAMKGPSHNGQSVFCLEGEWTKGTYTETYEREEPLRGPILQG